MNKYKIALQALFYDLEFFHKALSTSAKEELLSLKSLRQQLGIPPLEQEPTSMVERASALSLGLSLAQYRQQRNTAKCAQLRPVLELIGQPTHAYQYCFNGQVLEVSSAFFPTKATESGEFDLADTWKAFCDEATKLKGQSAKTMLENANFLLQKYASAVCVSENQPDISLYDHLKTAAAFASCLAADNLVEEQPFLLLGGDLSGIQDFIYDIVSKNAAKNLKGRSFYLQVLIESVLFKLKKALNLSSLNIVYSSGGGFYLIAPNTAATRTAIEEQRTFLSAKIFDTHSTRLFLAIDCVPFGDQDVHGQQGKKIGLSAIWAKLSEALNLQKRRRYADKLTDNYADFFASQGIEQGGEQERDAITNEEFQTGEKRHFLDDDKEIAVRPLTHKQILLGAKLKNAQYWVITDKQENGQQVFDPCQLGVKHVFISPEDKLPKMPETATCYRLNETELSKLAATKFINGFTFYGGNDYPTDSDEVTNNKGIVIPKSFDKLSGAEGEGFRRLGVLRMDVDNLGQAFIDGFGDKKTFSRYSCLSRSLDFFFKGYLNKIWEDYKEDSYILYAGGDDLFIVGKWDRLIHFAEQIKIEFAAWSGYNPKLTLSGGISIVTPKFPIVKGADLAGKAEKDAKHHQINLQGTVSSKNAFNLLGSSLSWDTEFLEVAVMKNHLLDFLNANNISKGFLNKLASFAERQADYGIPELKPKLRWQLAYEIAQSTQRLKDTQVKEKKFFNQLKTAVFTNSFVFSGKKGDEQRPYLALIAVAARWAELQYRSGV